jgi:putative ATP-binding cassette transporter
MGQINEIVPLLLAAPFYFAHLITLGVIAQTRIAYGQVAAALSWFVNAYQEIARWRAGIERLTSFAEMMDATEREVAAGGVRIEAAPDGALRLRDLGLEVPRGHALVEHIEAVVRPGERVVVLGPSGTGKTMLMRAIAGIWRFGAGRIEPPAGARTLFLPQLPYLPLGTLRAAVSFPAAEGRFDDARIAAALAALGLGHLVPLIAESGPWDQRLSPHEQQRVALARVLLHEPDWVFLDKATSALDPEMEKCVYDLIAEKLPRATLLSVAHRPEVAAYHERRWALMPAGEGRVAFQGA